MCVCVCVCNNVTNQNALHLLHLLLNYCLCLFTHQSSCQCLTSSCDCATDVGVSTLIPSLIQVLQEATPRGRTHQCPGRLFHSSTYDPYSNSVYIFGGADLSYNVCPLAFIQVYVGDSEESSSVRVLEDGNSPPGRYHHATVWIPVR